MILFFSLFLVFIPRKFSKFLSPSWILVPLQPKAKQPVLLAQQQNFNKIQDVPNAFESIQACKPLSTPSYLSFFWNPPYPGVVQERLKMPSYNPSWLTNADRFPATVSYFKEIIANSQVMDSSLQQSITSAVLFAVATTVTAIQAKHVNKMLAFREIIEKSLLLQDFPSATPPPDPDPSPKTLSIADSLPKTTTEKWN